jgi:hypothetical protein
MDYDIKIMIILQYDIFKGLFLKMLYDLPNITQGVDNGKGNSQSKWLDGSI